MSMIKQVLATKSAPRGKYPWIPLAIKETNEPALGRVRENSLIVFAEAKMPTIASKKAQGATVPINETATARATKIASVGAILASVDAMVSKRFSALRCRRG